MTNPAFYYFTSNALWINVSPSLQHLDQTLLGYLSQFMNLEQWSYTQALDGPSSIEVALNLLHSFIGESTDSIHLIGHSTSGLLAWLYARQFPHQVRSLTLLSVGVNLAINWQAQYYAQLALLPCKRTRILTQMAYALFGHQPKQPLQDLVKMLELDLTHSLSLHSPLKRLSLCPGYVSVPLLVCGGSEDPIINQPQLQGWQSWLKSGDRLWMCPGGSHFFQDTYPHTVAKQILGFWESIETLNISSSYSQSVS